MRKNSQITHFLAIALTLGTLLVVTKDGSIESDRSANRSSGKAVEAVGSFSPDTTTEDLLELDPLRANDPHLAFVDWLEGIKASAGPVPDSYIASGKSLARARKEVVYGMIKNDPKRALELMLRLDDYVAIPPAIAEYVEKPMSGFGDIDLLWATTVKPDGGTTCSGENQLFLNGQSYEAFGAGRRKLQKPAIGVYVFAYALDRRVLLLESPVYNLLEEELDAAQSLFESDERKSDPFTGVAVDESVSAVIGGTVHSFSDEGVIDHIAHSMIQDEDKAIQQRDWEVEQTFGWLAGDTGGSFPSFTQSSFFDDDDITVLVIRADFSDFPGEPVSKADLESDLAQVGGYLNEMSYGIASLTYTISNTIYRTVRTGENYAQDSGSGNANAVEDDENNVEGNQELYDDLVAAYDASPDALSSSSYDVVAVYFPDLKDVSGSQITYGGLASIGGTKMWINGLSTSNDRVSVLTHEFGHNYGLQHSNYWHPEQELSGDYLDPLGNSLEYGDIFDRMGGGLLPEAHFSHVQKHLIDWMPENNVTTATGDATYRIYRFDDVDATDNPLLALRVPMGDEVYWWVGHRQLYDSNPNLEDGAYVVAEGLDADHPILIDMTPESQPDESSDRFDAALPVGESYVVSESGVNFSTLASGTNGTGDEWIDVQIDFEPRAAFSSLIYDAEEASGIATLSLERQFESSGAFSVDFATSDNGATAGSDYYARSGTLTWEDGDTSDKTIVIHLRPDAVAETGEGFAVTLSNPVGGVVESSRSTATVSVLDRGERYSVFAPDSFNSTVNAVAFQSDGMTIIAGTIDHGSSDFAGVGNIARIDSNGNVDSTFNAAGSGFNGEVNALIALTDDRIIVGGAFTSYNGVSVPMIALLGADGDLDTSFNAALGAGPSNSPDKVDSGGNLIAPIVHSIAIDSYGRFLVGGAFDEFDGVSVEGLARLTAAGVHDTSLSAPFDASFHSVVYDIDVLEDGDFFVTGSFYVGWTGSGFRSGVLRLNDDGSIDPSFEPDAGLHVDESPTTLSSGRTLAIHPDGDFLVGGDFTGYDENTSERLVRINPDGTFDRGSPTSFDRPVSSLLVEPLGGVLVGEWKDLVENDPGASAANLELVRIDDDWLNDTNFSSLGAASGTVNVLEHAPDGSLWVGGNFFSYNGVSSQPIVRVASGVSQYEFWAAEHFTGPERLAGTSDPTMDPDGDGIANLAEMAFGTDPVVFTAVSDFGGGYVSGLSLATVGEDQYLQLTVDKSAIAGGVWYGVQVSTDLINWSPDPATPGDDSVFEIVEDSATSLIIRDRTAISPAAPRFARVVFDIPQ